MTIKTTTAIVVRLRYIMNFGLQAEGMKKDMMELTYFPMRYIFF